MDRLSVLRLTLHDHLVGHLVGYRSGRNILLFAEEFAQDPTRPTLGLITHPRFPKSAELLRRDWLRHQRLHPLLSNLLPEGALRELLAQGLKTHIDHEFELLAWLGQDLPGALIATPMAPDEVPETLLRRLAFADPAGIERIEPIDLASRFSLAGIQMKFSMKEKDGRYNLAQGGTDSAQTELGDWIIKTPSTRHAQVPLNEYSAMTLAAMAGIDIPEIRLIELDQLENLPPINLPQETQAFAIRRFDRRQIKGHIERIHMEDFAQVLVKYPKEKYGAANYEQIGRILYQYSGDGIADVQQLARRLLVNILLANGDAHLKNWSLLYNDRVTPRLSPAYDILTTRVYIDGERNAALNLAGNKDWYLASMNSFRRWADKSAILWRLIKPHLDDTLDRARTLWPEALQQQPMLERHKDALRIHWQRLHADFRIRTGATGPIKRP
ncbi:type II toxin-antitoxin system HipA family toxin [Pistricoccus aurantiacus]|uniref:type II toxin-antitoxin system HipA family toxin n=1 Tax=Pistricoccus aurantiacus TaxID=1883414 RepID=UPI003627A930